MSEAYLVGKCGTCRATGTMNTVDSEGNPISIPCPVCGGDGEVPTTTVMDTTVIMEELDYIHGKVTAIWNKIKDK